MSINNIDLRGCIKAAFLGKSRCGKSVTAAEIVKSLLSAKQKDKIIAHDPQYRLKSGGVKEKVEFIGDYKDLDQYVIKDANGQKKLTCMNVLLLVDECQMLSGNGRTPQSLLDILSLAGEFGWDVIFITHHPKLLPPNCALYLTHFFIFTTGSGSGSFDDDRIEGVQTLQYAKDIMSAYVKEHPKGADGFGEYPNFPFAFVQNTNETLKFINTPEITVENGVVRF